MKTILMILLSSVWSSYANKTYHTLSECEFNTTEERAMEVVDKFIYEFQADVTNLFTWAYIGTGNENDSERDAIGIKYKECYYNPETRESYNLVDVLVNGKPAFKDRRIGGKVQEKLENGTRNIRLDIEYSGSMLDKADAQFHVTPLDSNLVRVQLEINLKLGWFFNLFVTNRVWTNNVEWRLGVILDNLKEYAETGTVTKKSQTQALKKVKNKKKLE